MKWGKSGGLTRRSTCLPNDLHGQVLPLMDREMMGDVESLSEERSGEGGVCPRPHRAADELCEPSCMKCDVGD